MRRRGTIKPLSGGRFLLRAFMGKDASGKRLYTTKTVHGTKTDAQRALTELLSERDKQARLTPTNHTVASWAEEWLQAKRSVSAATSRSYRNLLSRHVLPTFGGTRLTKINSTMLQSWLSGMELSPRTVRYTHSVLSQMLKAAVRHNLIASNPAAGLELPRSVKGPRKVLSPEQMSTLLSHSRETKDSLYPLWAFLLSTGCRPSEALAVSREDIVGTTLRVSKALVLASDGSKAIGPPKTRAGVRQISLPESLLGALKGCPEKGLLFPNRLGRPLDLSLVRKRWISALKSAGLPETPLYSARHSHITALLAAGVPLKVASERAGHSSIVITADTYATVLPSMDEAASTLFDTLMKNGGKAERTREA